MNFWQKNCIWFKLTLRVWLSIGCAIQKKLSISCDSTELFAMFTYLFIIGLWHCGILWWRIYKIRLQSLGKSAVDWKNVVLVFWIIFYSGLDSEFLQNALPSESIGCEVRTFFTLSIDQKWSTCTNNLPQQEWIKHLKDLSQLYPYNFIHRVTKFCPHYFFTAKSESNELMLFVRWKFGNLQAGFWNLQVNKIVWLYQICTIRTFLQSKKVN